MRKLIILLLAPAVVVGLLSCGGNGKKAVNPPAEPVFVLMGTVGTTIYDSLGQMVGYTPRPNAMLTFEYSGENGWVDDGTRATSDSMGLYSITKSKVYFGKDYKLSHYYWFEAYGLIREGVDTVNVWL